MARAARALRRAAVAGSVELAELCKGLQHVLREEGIEVFAGLWPALRAELMETLDALPADLDDDVSS